MWDKEVSGRTVKVNGEPFKLGRITNATIEKDFDSQSVKEAKDIGGETIKLPTNFGALHCSDGKVAITLVIPNQSTLDSIKELKKDDVINAWVVKITQPRLSPNEKRTNAPRFAWLISAEKANPKPIEIEMEA